MARIEIYVKDVCGYCMLAKRLLKSKGQEWEEINVSRDMDRMSEMVERSGGRMTAPQIFVDGNLIGGWDQLSALEREGRLDAVLGIGEEA